MEELGKLLANEKDGLPDYLVDYWRARCFVAENKNAEARALFAKVVQRVEELATAGRANGDGWRMRIDKQLNLLNAREAAQHMNLSEQAVTDPQHINGCAASPLAPAAKKELIDQVWKIFEQSGYVQEVVLPRRLSPIVLGLCILLCLTYIASGAPDVLINIARLLSLIAAANTIWQSAAMLQLQSFYLQCAVHLQAFALEKESVFNGQIYRLVTYMFLHGNTTHLLLNVFGLYWFGRIAVNIYGPYKFLFLFFSTGILGGLAQMFFSDATAIWCLRRRAGSLRRRCRRHFPFGRRLARKNSPLRTDLDVSNSRQPVIDRSNHSPAFVHSHSRKCSYGRSHRWGRAGILTARAQAML